MNLAWLKAAKRAHRARFPDPEPLAATLDLILESGVRVSAVISETRYRQLQGLFEGQSDDAILNALIDDVCTRCGLD